MIFGTLGGGGAYYVTDYESSEVGIQIQIRNRQKPPKGPKDLADKPTIRRVE